MAQRRTRCTNDLDLVARVDGLAVYRKPTLGAATTWRNYYIWDEASARRRKRAYHLAFDGTRLARNHDAETIAKTRKPWRTKLTQVLLADHAEQLAPFDYSSF